MANNPFGLRPHISISEQLAFSEGSNAESLPFDALPKAKLPNGRTFVNEAHLAQRGRGRSSWVADEGLFVREILPGDRLGQSFWFCHRCDSRSRSPHPFGTDATTGLATHLAKDHRVFPPSQRNNEAKDEANDEGEPAAKKPRLKKAYGKGDTARARELALGYIINSNSPFTAFQDPFLKQLLILFNEDLHSVIPWSDTMLAADLNKLFKAKQPIIRKALQEAISHIHISFDLWTSGSNYAMMSVFAHFVNKEGKLARIQLGLRELRGAHSGENQAALLYEILASWGIEDLICAAVCDNAFNNDTALETLYPLCFDNFTKEDCFQRRLRCYGHILNLVGHAFIYGFDSETFSTRLTEAINSGDLRAELRAWRALGPVGKLRNIVKWVRSSPQRSAAFKAVELGDRDLVVEFTLWEESLRELKLILNNDTRWNSFYLMIERAILKRQQITAFQFTNRAGDPLPVEDILLDDDWDILVRIRNILKPLYDQTMRCQGWGNTNDHGRLWESLAGMEYLIGWFEEMGEKYEVGDEDVVRDIAENRPEEWNPAARRRGRAGGQRRFHSHPLEQLPPHARADYEGPIVLNPDYGHLQMSLDNAWKKLKVYYGKLSESPLYVASVILNPTMGLPFLERIWRPEWVAEAKRDVRAFWEKWYKQRESRASRASTMGPDPPPQGSFLAPLRAAAPVTNNTSSDFSEWLQDQATRLQVDEEDEFTRYLRTPLVPSCPDQVAYWLDHAASYPTLFQLALDILAIPSMATDCERSFSLAKLILSAQRLGMKMETLEMLLLLQNWARAGLISIGGVNLGTGIW